MDKAVGSGERGGGHVRRVIVGGMENHPRRVRKSLQLAAKVYGRSLRPPWLIIAEVRLYEDEVRKQFGRQAERFFGIGRAPDKPRTVICGLKQSREAKPNQKTFVRY